MNIKSDALLGCGVLLLCQAGTADERLARIDLDELEKAYWVCYQEAAEAVVAEQRSDALEMQICGGISLELQRRKFEGDFGRLHEWSLFKRQLLVGGTPYSPPYAILGYQDTPGEK